MKKVTYAIIGFLLLLATQSKSQNLIALQTNGVSTFFTKLPDAVTNAHDGDTIYISGGSYDQITIDKRLHLIGVGHHPDSTFCTNLSLCNSVYLTTGASGGSISGVRICDLNYGPSGIEMTTNFIVTRCWIGYCTLYPRSTNNSFSENIIQLLNGSNAINNIFLNNIIGQAESFGSNTFKNNDFLGGNQSCGSSGGTGSSISYISNSIFENNIIIGSSGIGSTIFNNNIFLNGLPTGENIGLNNLFNQDQSSIFINQTGNVFDYSHDYHLKSTCPGKNAGRDGTDIGIYGGAFPWKEGSVPANPHFQRVQIAPKTDTNGNLNVKIKMAAQER